MRPRHPICLEFSEPGESVAARLTDLSFSQHPFGRGGFARLRIAHHDNSICISKSGRTLLNGRVEACSDGSSVVLTGTSILLQAGFCAWWLAVAYGTYQLLIVLISSRRFDLKSFIESFLFAGFVFSLLFPLLCGRRWQLVQTAAVLGDRLHARNCAELGDARDSASLARTGAWTAWLSAFLWAPFLAISRFPAIFSGRQTSTAPWVDMARFLHDSVAVEGSLLCVMLLFGWLFVLAGIVSALLACQLVPSQFRKRRRRVTTVLALCISLTICWLSSHSNMLDTLFYMP